MCKFYLTILSVAILVATLLNRAWATCEGKKNFSRRPDPALCTKYYECISGKEFREDCPPGYYFNENTLSCTWQNRAKCGGTAPGGSSTGHGGKGITATYTCTAEDVTNKVFDGDASNCAKYYECKAVGAVTPVTCGTEKVFNPYAPEGSDKCSTLKEWWCPTETDTPDCSKLANNLKVYDPKSCANYYFCYNKALAHGSCSKGQRYNFEKQFCVTDDPDKCLQEATTEDNEDFKNPDIKEMCKGNNGKFFEDPSLCTAYFQCLSETLTYHAFCNQGTKTYFDNGKCVSTRPSRCTCEGLTSGLVKHSENENEYWECTTTGPEKRTCPVGYIFNGTLCKQK